MRTVIRAEIALLENKNGLQAKEIAWSILKHGSDAVERKFQSKKKVE